MTLGLMRLDGLICRRKAGVSNSTPPLTYPEGRCRQGFFHRLGRFLTAGMLGNQFVGRLVVALTRFGSLVQDLEHQANGRKVLISHPGLIAVFGHHQAMDAMCLGQHPPVRIVQTLDLTGIKRCQKGPKQGKNRISTLWLCESTGPQMTFPLSIPLPLDVISIISNIDFPVHRSGDKRNNLHITRRQIPLLPISLSSTSTFCLPNSVLHRLSDACPNA